MCLLVLINTVRFLRNRTKQNGTDGWKKDENGTILLTVLYSSVINMLHIFCHSNIDSKEKHSKDFSFNIGRSMVSECVL